MSEAHGIQIKRGRRSGSSDRTGLTVTLIYASHTRVASIWYKDAARRPIRPHLLPRSKATADPVGDLI